MSRMCLASLECLGSQLLALLLLRLGKAVVQVDLNAQLLRLIGQLGDQLGILELRDVARRFLGADIEHCPQLPARL